ncbi:hypothetical protein [Paraburkholderia saeva]|uniref:Phosphate starvation-inducible protein PsiF n=1 Tax=Paraburkholderia saeva TaxID=2777537 RepID=A0A9N8RVZ3_9BURK|nr:hypothetical protein [Paraburkholderia saeva]CAG4894271.1 hypothetical protein LMG31841_01881 [Paraburkholderia saeva]CAG4899112.1 hypothetical protein R70241_02575 [Paraburkholderia saeva]
MFHAFRIAYVALGATLLALAFDARAAAPATPSAAKPVVTTVAAEDGGTPKTLKERLGDKASDEQRVDNCKVPLESRGSKARPDACRQP